MLRGGVAQVSVVGRRGHVQGAFTIKELRELVELEKEGHRAAFCVRPEELEMGRGRFDCKEEEEKAMQDYSCSLFPRR